MAEISFFVAGQPVPGGSKKAFVNSRTGRVNLVDDSGRRGKDWRADVRAAAQEVYKGPLLDGPLAVAFVFVQRRPAGHYGTGRNRGKLKANAPPYPIGKPDVTKLIRSTEDALKGILWTDDSRIVVQFGEKNYGDNPGARITIKEQV